VTLGTFVMLRYFAAAETSWAVRLQVMLSWTLSLSIIALVPADVAATMRGRGTGCTVQGLGYSVGFRI